LCHKFILGIGMGEHFVDVELVHGAVAVFDVPVGDPPGGVFVAAGAVAVAGCEVCGWLGEGEEEGA